MSNEKITHMAYNGNYVDFKDNLHSMMNDALNSALETKFGGSKEDETTNEEKEDSEEEEESSLEEKSVSQNQQKLMGMAYAYKKGELSSSEVSNEVKEIASGMSLDKLKDFASTKHDKLPKKKD